jgi:hypothetical protein
MSDLLGKLLLLLVTLAAALGGAEYAARRLGHPPTPAVGNAHFSGDSQFGWAEFDPVVGWRNKAGVWLSLEPGNVPMTFWSDGRRATRPSPDVAPLPQVVIVGDSFSQGYGVVDAETFAWRLAEAAPSVDVENFGTGGYGAYQSLLALRRIFASKGAPYAPKLAVYGYTDFHAYRDVAGYSWVRTLLDRHGQYFAPPSVAAKDGRLVEYPFVVFPRWPLEGSSSLVALAKDARLRLLVRDREATAEEATKLLVAELRTLATLNAARFVVMELTRAPTSIDAFLRSRGIEAVSCSDFDPGLVLADPAFKVGGTGHPNGRVHASWARCLAHWMDAHPLR